MSDKENRRKSRRVKENTDIAEKSARKKFRKKERHHDIKIDKKKQHRKKRAVKKTVDGARKGEIVVDSNHFNEKDTVKQDGESKNASKTAENKEISQKNVADENIEKEAVKPRKMIENPLLKYAKRVGKTKILVKGANAVRAVSAISKTYKVEGVCVLKEGVAFLVSSKHCDKIIALLSNLCYDYKIVNSQGALVRVMHALARVGVVAGLVGVICVFAIYPSFITGIRVQSVGDYAIEDKLNSQICDILSSYGVENGKRAVGVDWQQVQTDILKLDGVAFASVEKNGTHIVVKVKPKMREDILDISGSAVKARKRAVVSRIVVESGTAVKKYGDVVDAGDVIIDGYIEYGDEKIPVQASGYAYGRVYYEKEIFFPDTVIERTYGAQKTITKLSMFGKIPSKPKSPFEVYECQISVESFGFLLPFEVYTYTFRSFTTNERQNGLSDEEMTKAVYSNIVEEFQEETRVLDVISTLNRAEGGVYVKVVVEAEELI